MVELIAENSGAVIKKTVSISESSSLFSCEIDFSYSKLAFLNPLKMYFVHFSKIQQ